MLEPKRRMMIVAAGLSILGAGVMSGPVGASNEIGTTGGRSVLSALSSGLHEIAERTGLGDESGVPSALDDGKDLLPLATITLDDAIEKALAVEAGDLGEVDLEYFEGALVFNVDVGVHDVKVDAATGDVLGSEVDD